MIHSNLIDHIKYIKLSSGKGNLLTSSDVEVLREILRESAQNKDISGLVISGERHCFCTGFNVGGTGNTDLHFSNFDGFLIELFSFPKPVVVAIDGHSIGGGLLLQCCADYVVASDSKMTKIGLPELKLGLTVDKLMISLLNYNLRRPRLLQKLLYSGDYITIQQAKEMDIVDDIIEGSVLETEARKACLKLCEYAPVAFGITKLKLREHTLQQMQASLNDKCYKVFNDLMK
ncbi:enoyl-CoA hydratase/isomerase family protein [Parabacteroides goldsteinii]|jgi:enoyl-CoA hydratase/carnithine racemase|uniref:Enoyl-CoA hydratase/isomerase n=1 Tax=Parabacteroides goldsteinii DSM 19448 = WAL 12034 TaxID=927665 RepID=A0A0F5J6W1_9BACT|nr:enoyl-CoA hydratase/isomerase family protein [Parabacteroides goldsteinii]KKB53508.1 hypothetical protein HMPREF1535_03049 [Parabacteroides goldsteinii DSM 19448 = WAL 12034]UBD75781.1 enoyl-CoA hydratase/isomerase family protein [Parabacteroides goldsteinii]